jgi:hypothetical protein
MATRRTPDDSPGAEMDERHGHQRDNAQSGRIKQLEQELATARERIKQLERDVERAHITSEPTPKPEGKPKKKSAGKPALVWKDTTAKSHRYPSFEADAGNGAFYTVRPFWMTRGGRGEPIKSGGFKAEFCTGAKPIKLQTIGEPAKTADAAKKLCEQHHLGEGER